MNPYQIAGIADDHKDWGAQERKQENEANGDDYHEPETI